MERWLMAAERTPRWYWTIHALSDYMYRKWGSGDEYATGGNDFSCVCIIKPTIFY